MAEETRCRGSPRICVEPARREPAPPRRQALLQPTASRTPSLYRFSSRAFPRSPAPSIETRSAPGIETRSAARSSCRLRLPSREPPRRQALAAPWPRVLSKIPQARRWSANRPPAGRVPWAKTTGRVSWAKTAGRRPPNPPTATLARQEQRTTAVSSEPPVAKGPSPTRQASLPRQIPS